MLVGGGLVVAASTLAHRALGDAMPAWLHGGALGLGGLAVVFGSCDAMIRSVEGVGRRVGWNPFVAGTMAGLASNVPELVMLGFVLAAAPRVGFIVTCLTLHVGALAFGLYSVFLPRDKTGHARLPEPLVKIEAPAPESWQAGSQIIQSCTSWMNLPSCLRRLQKGHPVQAGSTTRALIPANLLSLLIM